MSRKVFWYIALTFAVVTFILGNVFRTRIGEVLLQISFLALVIAIVMWTYQIIKFTIKQEMYNRKKKREKDDD